MVKNRTFLNSQNRTFLFSRYNHTSYNLYYVKLYICSSVMWFDLSTKKIPHNRGVFLRRY